MKINELFINSLDANRKYAEAGESEQTVNLLLYC